MSTATAAQISYLEDLGATADQIQSVDKLTASFLIDHLKGRQRLIGRIESLRGADLGGYTLDDFRLVIVKRHRPLKVRVNRRRPNFAPVDVDHTAILIRPESTRHQLDGVRGEIEIDGLTVRVMGASVDPEVRAETIASEGEIVDEIAIPAVSTLTESLLMGLAQLARRTN